jgi:hypothetical protein
MATPKRLEHAAIPPVSKVPPTPAEAVFLKRIAHLGGRHHALNKKQTAAALALHRSVPGYRAKDVLVILQLRGL